MRAPAIALLLVTTTAYADPAWVFTGGIGRAWPRFVPSGYRTLDAGIGGFVGVSLPVYTLADHSLSVEVGGRVASEYMNGQQFMGSISNEYEYLSFGGLVEGRLLVRDRVWLGLAGGYHHARIHDSAASNQTTSDGDDSYTLLSELGVDVYSGIGLYTDLGYLGAGGAFIGLGVTFRITPGP